MTDEPKLDINALLGMPGPFAEDAEGADEKARTPIAGDASTTAVMLMGFGGPDCLDAVEPFMCNLMDDRPAPELVEHIRHRYLAIGGCSPMLPIVQHLASEIEYQLTSKGHMVPVTYGMAYWHPYVGDVIRGMYEVGIRRIVTVSLSPYESAVSSGAYRAAIEGALPELPGLEMIATPSLHTLSTFGALLVGNAAVALHDLEKVTPKLAVFTAHSLPMSDIAEDDSYVSQLRDTLHGVAVALQLSEGHELDGSDPKLPGIVGYGDLGDPQPWVFAYQSKGRKPGEWLGPDLDDVIDAAAAGGFSGVAMCPIGFAVENMETKYDLDVVAADRLLQADLEYSRADLPNDDPLIVEAIADAVAALL